MNQQNGEKEQSGTGAMSVSESAVQHFVMPDDGKGSDCPDICNDDCANCIHLPLKSGDRVKITRVIAPEDLPIGSTGTVKQWDAVCTDMVHILWDDIGWGGLYWPKDLQRA